MGPYLLLVTAQIVVFCFFFSKTLKRKENKDQILFIILFCCSLGLISKLIIQFSNLPVNFEYGISSTIGFSTFAFLYIKHIFTEKPIRRIELILFSIPFFSTAIIFLIELLFNKEISNHPGLAKLIDMYVLNFRRFTIVACFLGDIYLLFKYWDSVKKRIRSNEIGLALSFICYNFLLCFLISSSLLFKPFDYQVILYLGLASSSIIVLLIVYFNFINTYKDYLGLSVQSASKLSRVLTKANDEKYQKNSAKIEGLKPLVAQIDELMKRDKPFLNPEYALSDLANSLGISNHDLSIILNNLMNTTFYQYINSKRVSYFIAHSKRIVQEDQNILNLAYESGFHSQCIVKRYFKLESGQSTSEHLIKKIMQTY